MILKISQSIFLFSLFFLNSTYASNICTNSIEQETQPVAKATCDAIDKMYTCSEKSKNTPDIRQKLKENFLLSEKNKNDIQKKWKHYKTTNIAQFFNAKIDNNINSSTQGKVILTPIVDWVTNNGTLGDFSRDEIREFIIQRYIEFAEKHDCTPVIRNSDTINYKYPKDITMEVSSDSLKTREIKKKLLEEINIPENIKSKDEFFKDMNSKFSKTGIICNPNSLNLGPFTRTEIMYAPCSGNFKSYFKDNEWSNTDWKNNTSDELANCIKDRLSKGAKIHHISITSSASALNNTGDAAKQFCKKGFLALSQKRAETAKNHILPELLNAADSNINISNININMDYKGSNNDGTSGPCPYEIINGKEVLKKEYTTQDGKNSLDEYKFVKIHITFEENSLKLPKQKKYFEPFYQCKKIDFICP